jgi:hypothetical protein
MASISYQGDQRVCENPLMDACQACTGGVRNDRLPRIWVHEQLGHGLLVTFIRPHSEPRLMAWGWRPLPRIFELTRLNGAIAIYGSRKKRGSGKNQCTVTSVQYAVME